MEHIDQRVFIESSEPTNHPRAQVWVPPEYTLTGGGAIALWGGAGSLLTASYPIRKEGERDYRGWEASAKDHRVADPSPLVVYAVGIRILSDGSPVKFDQDVVQATSQQSVGHPKVSASLNNAESVLTGGGAIVHSRTGAGNLLTASFPVSPDGGSTYTGWEAHSKDHVLPDPATITVYAIGIELPAALASQLRIEQRVVVYSTTNPVNHPRGEVGLDDGFTLTGGGGIDNWDGDGNLLTGSVPRRRPDEIHYAAWQVSGKDHEKPDVATVTSYAVGIRVG